MGQPTVDELAAKVRQLEGTAEKQERVADEARWEAARLYHEACVEQGAKQAAFARLVGKSPRHVSWMVRTWGRYGSDRNPEWGFWWHYHKVREAPAENGDQVRETGGARPTRAQVAEAVRADRKLAEEVVADVLGSDDGAEVVERVFDRSTRAAANVSRGSERRRERHERAAHDRVRDSFGEGWQANGHVLAAHRHLDSARFQVERAREEVEAAGTLDAEVLDALAGDVARLLLAVDWFKVRAGNAGRTIDEQLAEMLAEEGGA